MVKKSFSIIFFFVCICTYAQNNQQNQLSIFHTTRASGLGGAISSVPEGIESILYNPAGLSIDVPWQTCPWTFIVSGNTYFEPKYLFSLLNPGTSNSDSTSQILVNAKDLITSSGFGSSLTLSTAYTGENFGSGLFISASSFLQGEPFPLGTDGFVKIEANLPLAYGMSLYKRENISLDVGIALRPGILFYRMLNGSDVDSLVSGKENVSSIISFAIQNPYISMPVDTGLIFTIHEKPYNKAQIRFSCTTKNLFGDYIIPGSSLCPLTYPVSIQTGMAMILPYKLFGIKSYTLFSVELQGINDVVSGSTSFWQSLRMGMEFALGKTFRIQLGLTSGYPSLAARFSLFWASVAFSWQTVETGAYIQDNPLSVFRLSLLFSPCK